MKEHGLAYPHPSPWAPPTQDQRVPHQGLSVPLCMPHTKRRPRRKSSQGRWSLDGCQETWFQTPSCCLTLGSTHKAGGGGVWEKAWGRGVLGCEGTGLSQGSCGREHSRQDTAHHRGREGHTHFIGTHTLYWGHTVGMAEALTHPHRAASLHERLPRTAGRGQAKRKRAWPPWKVSGEARQAMPGL